MATWLYLEGSCGIAGDMLVAALCALGGRAEAVETALAPLAAEGLRWHFESGESHGLSGLRFCTELPEAFGKDAHHAAHGHHAHRHLADVLAVIARLPMAEAARAVARRAFEILADGEAQAHGCTREEVHFHEVGALDSIADVVAAAVLYADLGCPPCVVEALTEGCGTITCAHGQLPVPVPAVLAIAQAHAVALSPSQVQGERITPTGIALAVALRSAQQRPARYTVRRVGAGLGERDFGVANCLRAMLIEAERGEHERVVEIEANLDDCPGQTLAIASERLFAAGALDVACLPCTMKKGRPAQIIKVLAPEPLVHALAEVLFRETTTIGLRYHLCHRLCMTREAVSIETPYGPVRAKRCTYGALVRVYPESDSVRALAERCAVPYAELFALACAHA